MTRLSIGFIALAATAHMACWAEPKPWEVCGEGGYIVAEHIFEDARASLDAHEKSRQVAEREQRYMLEAEASTFCVSATRLATRLGVSCGYFEFDGVWNGEKQFGTCLTIRGKKRGPQGARSLRLWLQHLRFSLTAMKALGG